ncbi:MAG: hypothetical protein M3N13_02540 [Candidatus Eremiobacteraeota bacterium]|nr:hypothetical protein [Candidatus Eremiobacteraeota bacterium]
MNLILALVVWSLATVATDDRPAAAPSPRASVTVPATAENGEQPDIGFHADIRAESLKYDVVPHHAGTHVTGKNVRSHVSNVTDVASPQPGTTYRNVHAVYDIRARFVDPHAGPKPRATS